MESLAVVVQDEELHSESRPLLRSVPRPATRAEPGWRWVLRPVAVFAGSRLVVLLAAGIAVLLRQHPGAGPWPDLPKGTFPLLGVFGRWDAAWYVWVAHRGYPDAAHLHQHLSDVSFFPLHPALLRGLTDLTHLPALAAGLIEVTVLGAVAAVLFWALARRLAGPVVANRATVLFCLFPGSFAFSWVYAEPVMVVLILACLLLLLDRRWLLAGVAAALATASRPNAAVVIVPCLWAAAEAVVRRREWKALLAPALAPVGVAGFFAYLWVHSGSPTAWFISERKMWHDHTTFGGPVVHRMVHLLAHPVASLHSGGLNLLLDNLGVVAVAAGLYLLWRTGWPRLVVAFTAAALLFPLTSAAVGPRPRMLLAAFPLAIALAGRLPRKAYVAAAVASGAALCALSLVTATTLAATP